MLQLRVTEKEDFSIFLAKFNIVNWLRHDLVETLWIEEACPPFSWPASVARCSGAVVNHHPLQPCIHIRREC